MSPTLPEVDANKVNVLHYALRRNYPLQTVRHRRTPWLVHGKVSPNAFLRVQA